MENYYKIAALDLGDRWIGVALSDPLRILARPFKTIERSQLTSFLHECIDQESIRTIVVGYPITLRGRESQQTKQVVADVDMLKNEFPTIEWVLWDERLTSKQAAQLSKKKQDKQTEHAMAAALILQTYLTSRSYIHRDNHEEND